MLQEIPTLISYLKDIIRGDRRYIRFFWDQLITGKSERDTWSLDFNLAEIILPRIILLRIFKVGYPACFDKEEEWDIILDKMIFAFEKVMECEGGPSEFEDEIDEGLKLFGKYYRGLWW